MRTCSLPVTTMLGSGFLLSLTGAILTVLLSVIAYFLNFLVQDFRELQKEFMEIKAKQLALEAEINGISELLLFVKKQLMRRRV